MMSDATLTLVQNIMGPVGAVLASAMFLSSIPVMRYIMSTKGVGEYSCFPYVVQTCNCALWTTYSITYWQGGKMLWPLLTNGLGLLIASVSLLVYLCFCGRDALRGLVPYYSPVVLATAAFCVYALVTMTDTVAMVAGDFCLVINMIMYLGPCAGIRAAITTRSTEFLPLTLGISTITCSLPWFFFGVSIANLTIWLPNACGIVFGTVQVIVFAWLSRTTPPGQEAGTSCVSSMNADGTMHPKLQHFATSGDIFSFVGSKVEAYLEVCADLGRNAALYACGWAGRC
jgi:solute carrier family 50 protein (sugar transporter)